MKYPYQLPELPYSFEALEPFIDSKTMEIHYNKHHASYVTKLNEALANWPEWQEKELEELLENLNSLPEEIKTTVKNQGGGHYNHSLFWQILKKNEGRKPGGELLEAINKNFGDFANFKEIFSKTAASVFGSGWAWLVKENLNLLVVSTPNQDTPLSLKQTPILCLDLWEHAYYLKYQNRRQEYIESWWSIVNWEIAEEKFRKIW